MLVYDCGSIFSVFLFDILYFDCLSFGKQTNNNFRGNMFFNVSQTNFYKVYVRNLICKNIYKISKWRSKISKTFDRSEFINTRKKDPCRPETYGNILSLLFNKIDEKLYCTF